MGKRVTGKLLRLCSAGALACTLLAGCAAAPETYAPPPAGVTTVPAPAVKAGDFWEYAVRDAYTGAPRGLYRYTVSRVDAERMTVEIARDGQAIDTHVYTPDWRGLEHPLRNTQRFRYAPPYPAYVFPLYPGQSWRSVVDATDTETGRSYRTHVHASVGGWRRIKVPAGEFDTLEVKRRVYAGNAEFFNSQEEIVETDWYAPSVGRAVAAEGSSAHVDTSRGGGGRNRYLVVRGEWLVAELVRHSAR